MLNPFILIVCIWVIKLSNAGGAEESSASTTLGSEDLKVALTASESISSQTSVPSPKQVSYFQTSLPSHQLAYKHIIAKSGCPYVIFLNGFHSDMTGRKV